MALKAVKAFALRWRFTVTLAIATAVAMVGLLVVWTRHDRLAHALVDAAQLWFPLALFCGAALLLSRWLFLDEPECAWLGCILILLAIYLRPKAYMAVSGAEGTIIGIPDVGVILTVLWITHCSTRQVPPRGWRNPILLGIVSGLGFSAARYVWVSLAPETPPAYVLGEFAFFVIVAIYCAHQVVRMDFSQPEFRWQYAVPLAIGLGCHHFLPVTEGSLGAFELISTAVSLVSAICLVSTTLALLQEAYLQHHMQLAELGERVSEAEVRLHRDEELRHEARATVAGITNASQLLIDRTAALEKRQASQLRSMLESEMVRLQTLLAAPAETRTEIGDQDLDLDQVVSGLVVSLRAQGMQIDHQPSGVLVHTDPEALTTTVHVLLCNAKRHAPGARITVWTTITAEHAVLHVSDDGPGLPQEVAELLFTRGAKAPDSPGQGIGLYSARKAIRAHGGDLTTHPQPAGTDFAVTIPRVA